MRDIAIGTSAYPTADAGLMKEAGIGWVRHGFPLPFADRVGGEVSQKYREAKAGAEGWAAKGFQIMGVSPGPGIMKYERDPEGNMRHKWHAGLPDWFGVPGTPEFLRNYRSVCAFLADDLRGLVRMWQIANELDITVFAGPLSPREAAELIAHGARGLKEADGSLIVGPNTAGSAKAYYLYGRLYADADADSPIDYCGVDGYNGTWASGGPGDWAGRIAELHELTGAPVLVNEWGFSSAGGVVTQEEAREGSPVCRLKKWYHTWGAGHSPEGQAEYVKAAFEAFCSESNKLLGVFLYRWEDQEACWQCGAPDCPAETAWGIVDLDGKPKPSFDAFREGARLLGS